MKMDRHHQKKFHLVTNLHGQKHQVDSVILDRHSNKMMNNLHQLQLKVAQDRHVQDLTLVNRLGLKNVR